MRDEDERTPMTVDEFNDATGGFYALLDHIAGTLNWIAEEMYRSAKENPERRNVYPPPHLGG